MSSLKDKQTLKILCLHGYRQTSDGFKSKTGGFRKGFKNKLEFVFIDGPNTIPTGAQNPSGEDCKSWWFSDTNPDYFSSAQDSDICNGFEESLILIKSTFDNQGPFDGILGFSQGSALVALLCCLKALNEFKYDFKFVVMIASFKSLSTKHLQLFDRLDGRLIDIPSLHIIGESDQIIAKTKSEQLLQYFSDPCVVYHSGGHLVPSNSTLRQQFNQFFNQFI